MDTLTLSRIIFLLFIVILSVYFIYLNKNFAERKEHFTADDDLNTIKSTYQSEFKRDPTQQEIDFWVAYISEKKPTNDQLVTIIKSSADIISQSYSQSNSRSQNILLKEAYGTEDDVTEIYNNILNRLPNEQELYNYAKMLKEDKTFTPDKLKQVLYASDEYQRLEKTQSNQVYSNVIGGVTDRQITLIVMTVYKEVVGKETIDADELHFLKKKLVDFNLDEVIFKKFLEYYIKNQPFNQQIAAAEKVKQMEKINSQQVSQEQAAVELAKMKKELYSELMSDLKNQGLLTTNSKQGYTDQRGTEHTELKQANKDVIDKLKQEQCDGDNNYLDSSNVIDKIKQQSSCVFNKNAADQKYQDDQASMANLINQRNNQNLKDTCVRNKMYLGLDENMVLDPALKWKFPDKRPPLCIGDKNTYQPMTDQSALIGTLLKDASNTKVGDVVSPLPPK